MSENAPEKPHYPGEPAQMKKVSFSHKQLGIGGVSLIAALYALEPLRDFVRNETAPQEIQIERLQDDMASLKNEITSALSVAKLELSGQISSEANRIIQQTKDVEARSEEADKRQDRERENMDKEVAELNRAFIKHLDTAKGGK